MIILKAVCGVIQLCYIIPKGLSGIDKGSPGGEGVYLPTMYPHLPSFHAITLLSTIKYRKIK